MRRAEADEKLAAWIEAAPIEDVVRWERQPLFADQSDALVEAQRAGRLVADPRSLGLAASHRRSGRARAGVARAPHVELPVLAIAGARDDGYTRAAKRSRRPRRTAGGASWRKRGMRPSCNNRMRWLA